MMAGLLVSLVIRRRRIWVRLRPGPRHGEVAVDMGGLARTDHAGWGPEFTTLSVRLLTPAADLRASSITDSKSGQT